MKSTKWQGLGIGAGPSLTGIALLCMVLMCVACADPAEPPQASPPSAHSMAPPQLVLPFDEYKFNSREESTLGRAHVRLVNRCMRGRGLDVSMPEGSESPYIPDNSRRYGIIDEDTARRFGYHFPADPDSERRLRELQNWESGLSENERAVLYGEAGKPGCVDQASTDLGQGTPTVDISWLTSQDFRSVDESAKSEGVVQALERWRACMSNLSFTYADPTAAISDPQWKLNTPTITARERETALADVRCKQASQLVNTWHAAEVTLQREVIQQDQARFTEFTANKRVRLSNAHRVLGP